MAECPGCHKEVRVTTAGKYYKHDAEDGDTCDWTGVAHTPPHYQDSDPFTPPSKVRAVSDAIPMSPKGQEVCARLKEIFYSYVNRRSSDNRGAQPTLGPSEAGTPCDRRLALSLMRFPPVNPGGDNWASFVGTCVHAGLAEMFLWAGGHTGRYAVEIPLSFGSAVMPKGTGDLLDRTLCLFLDHKVMGRWSLDAIRTSGAPAQYVTQVMLYAHAARKAGETVEQVAIVCWPREGSNLDDLYVWTAPYDPAVAANAIARVERISQQLGDSPSLRDVAARFGAEDDCRYCPYHAPGDDKFSRGCPGR